MADEATPAPPAPVTIKKYANRRLYNTESSSYVTLDNLCQMVKDGREFLVHDAKSGEDITRSVLTQIIFEEESKGSNLLPIGFLRQLIGFYGDSLQSLVPSYLELSMAAFSRNQEQMRSTMGEAFGDIFPFKNFEEMGRNNMVMFQRAMAMFNPFAAAAAEANSPKGGERPKDRPLDRDDIVNLKEQMNNLQKRLDQIADKK